MTHRQYIACELGVETCRVVVGSVVGGRLSAAEVHRFATPVVRLPGPSVRWDVLAIYAGVKLAMGAVARVGGRVAGVSVSSWGSDYAYAARGQPLLWPPYHHRDGRTAATFGPLVEQLGADYIYNRTGTRFEPRQTLYQVAADVADHPAAVAAATDLLPIADHLNHLLCGVARAEETLAATTGLFEPTDRGWAFDLIDLVGLSPTLFPVVVPGGTVLGPLLPDVAVETGLSADVVVIAGCSNADAAAVFAVPATAGEDWAYLSAGVGSALGVELPAPLVNGEVRAARFTNEAGFGGTTRVFKPVAGPSMVRDLRRAWAAAGQALDDDEVTGFAALNEPFRSLVDPTDGRFADAADLPAAIAARCRETGQPEPESPGQFARCLFESLALHWAATLAEAAALTGRAVRRLHVVGDGSRNELLNQMVADATGVEVVAGPADATAIGNLLAQAIAVGRIESLAAARRAVAESFPTATFRPSGDLDWRRASARFRQLGEQA